MRHMNKEPYVPDDAAKAAVWGHLQTMRDKERNLERRRIWLPRMGSAAAVLLIAAAALYFIGPGGNEKTDPAASTHVADIHPGGNRATLTLSDGRTVDLSSEQTGIIVGDGITYADGAKVFSQEARKSGSQESHISHLLSLSTPKGGQYQITLSDGTKVWLNAASTLKYPSRFSGSERMVEVTGEAYFSISADEGRPFRVLSKGQEIDVLGTEFNINAYNGQQEIRTTLVSGAVKVRSPQQVVVLKPGEQSMADGYGRLTSQAVDVDLAVAWKSGVFYFKRTPFEEMIQQVARWYDIEIVYKRGIPKETFSGKINRDASLSSVLDFMKGSGIRFRMIGDKLMIE